MEGSRPVLVKHVAPTFYGRYFNVTDRFLTPSSMPNVWPSRKVNRLPIFRPYKEPPSALCTAHWGVPPYHGQSRGGPIFLRPLFFCWRIGFLPHPACHVWPSREVNRLPLQFDLKKNPPLHCVLKGPTRIWSITWFLFFWGPYFLCWRIGFLPHPACQMLDHLGRSIDYPLTRGVSEISVLGTWYWSH